jgi:hypothetical protein
MNTDTTLKELQQMNDEEIIQLIRKFPYSGQWKDKKALAHINYHLALMQGRDYQKTGNLKSFSKSI